MKHKKVFTISNTVDEILKQVIYEIPKKCQLYRLINDQLFQNNIEVLIEFIPIKFHQSFADSLINIIDKTHEEVPSIKNITRIGTATIWDNVEWKDGSNS